LSDKTHNEIQDSEKRSNYANPGYEPTKTGLGGVITEGLGKNCYCFYTDYPAYNETSPLKKQNKQNSCSPKGPGESPFWKSLKPYKGSIKTNGLSRKKRRYYEWDYTHNDIVYDSVRSGNCNSEIAAAPILYPD
ncbi:15383_t:CDS:2, partial [Gigaspora margarita]